MKILSTTVVSAVLAGLLAGCSDTPKLSIDRTREPDPRDAYRKKADDFIRNYVTPEDKIPVEYMPEWAKRADYKDQAERVRRIYENINLFRSAKKWDFISLVYRDTTGKSELRLTAGRKGAKLKLELLDLEKKAPTYVISAEIPEIIQMPGSIPANMEESVAREMNMIFQFLMNPQLPAKTVSVKTHPLMNIVTKTMVDEYQEFVVNGKFCYRFEIALKESYSGSLLYFYVSADPRHELRRVDIPALAMAGGSSNAVSVAFPAYRSKDGCSVPDVIVCNGKEYKLQEEVSSVELIPPTDVASAEAGKEAAEQPAATASENESEKKPEAVKEDDDTAEEEAEAKTDEKAEAKADEKSAKPAASDEKKEDAKSDDKTDDSDDEEDEEDEEE